MKIEDFEKTIEIISRDKLIPCHISIDEKIKESIGDEPLIGVNIRLENSIFGKKEWFLMEGDCEVILRWGKEPASTFITRVYRSEWDEFLAKKSGLI